MLRIQRATSAPKVICLLGALVSASTAIAGKTVYTTNSAGTAVNQNHFATKADVYVRDETDGTYYFQVTDPSGNTLLSSDSAACRQLVVSGGLASTAVSGGCGHAIGSGGNAVQLIDFADTPNNGGAYKVWMIPQSCVTGVSGAVITFGNGCGVKTDNFKLASSCPGGVCTPLQSTISGMIYYDGNANGVNNSEPPLQGWQINITLIPGGLVTRTTDGNGAWFVTADTGTQYTACEVLPAGTSWEQKGPIPGTPGTSGQCWVGTFDTADATGLDFGDVTKVGGKKYYDANANGKFDGGELPIAGFHIVTGFCNLPSGCTYSPATTIITAADGTWSLYSPLPPNGTNTFDVCEVLPPGTYKQTGPLAGASNGGTATAIKPGGGSSACWLGTLSDASGANANLDFGNICLGGGNAKSKGWWQNNGNSSITDSALSLLGALSLRNANGSDFDPSSGAAGRAQVSAWLSGATATNMANMLSAQMATLQLDVFLNPPGTNGNAVIYAPGAATANSLGYAVLNNVMAEANGELFVHPLAGTGTAWRSYQEALKNAFDSAANNLNFVQPGACSFVYPF
jgi:hypothetical protein